LAIYSRVVTLAELATRLGCRLDGDGTIEVHRVAGIESAGPGDVTFLSNPKYAPKVASTRASAVIADESIVSAPCAVLRTSEPYLMFAQAVATLTPPVRPAPGVSPLASIDPTAVIGPDVSIGPFVAIGARARIGARTTIASHVAIGPDVIVGVDCTIHAHASIREDVTLGDRVVLQNAAVIGSDGFGFDRRADGSHQKIPQVGRVLIGNDVEIGAHAAVDRPAVGETRIADGTKVDNLVQIAHGVTIGRHVLMAAQSGVAGSSTFGDDVVIAGQAGVTGHVHLGNGVIVGAKSVVTKDVRAGQHVTGFPAVDVERWRATMALIQRLPALRRSVVALDARLAALEARLKGE
jgi:UDP-3-O-[3-hydroxymyristoyl] glucosamine N-acyltransferase